MIGETEGIEEADERGRKCKLKGERRGGLGGEGGWSGGRRVRDMEIYENEKNKVVKRARADKPSRTTSAG